MTNVNGPAIQAPVTGIGDEKSASCQPDPDSLVKVTWPSRVPLERVL